MAREDRDGSGVEREFMAISPVGGFSGKLKRIVRGGRPD
jgi:hypothetical protein